MVLLEIIVTVSLLPPGLNVVGINGESLVKDITSPHELHKLDKGCAQIGVILGDVRIASNSLLILLDCLRELAWVISLFTFFEETVAFVAVLLGKFRIDIGLVVSLLLQFLDLQQFVLDSRLVVFN